MELEKIKYICEEKSNEGIYDYKMEVPRDFWYEVLQIIESLEAKE